MTDRLERSRRSLEESVERLRAALGSEFGAAPRLGRWALVVVVAAAGFVLGGAAGARLADRRRRRLSRG
jgi:hypothetical protein